MRKRQRSQGARRTSGRWRWTRACAERWRAGQRRRSMTTALERRSPRQPGRAANLFPAGVTTVAYTATDAAGLTATCSFAVTVSPDAQAPTIAGCPANIGPVAMDAGVCGAVASWTAPTVNDNCPGATIAPTAGPSSGSLSPAGVTTVTYTATDAAGLTATCSFTVTVSPDAQAPTIEGAR